MSIPAQECDNCQYPAPQRKKPEQQSQNQQGSYQPAGTQGADDCSQCFYQPESVKKTGE